MRPPARVCAFYAVGPNYPERLRALRARHPAAHITLMVPAGFQIADGDRPFVDEVVAMERDHYSPAEVAECLQLIRSIRRKRFDAFVVAYPTLQLRMLAALSGARRCECWRQDNQIEPLTPWWPWVLPAKALRILRGILSYLRLAAVTYLIPVRPPRPR